VITTAAVLNARSAGPRQRRILEAGAP
jgi:hypothetical protein